MLQMKTHFIGHMISDYLNESETEAFAIESARDVVVCSPIVQRSLTPLDLNACEYMLLRRSFFTQEGYRKMCQPNRKILYTLHLDISSDLEPRIVASDEVGRYRAFYLEVGECVYNRDFAPIIVNNIRLAQNKTEKLRRYMHIMKLLKLGKHRKTANFIFDSIIQVLYPDCMDSNLVVEFAETFSFYSWIYYRENPDIVGYVLEHARRIRYNIWQSSDWRLDPINACIIFKTAGNIGKLLEYGTVLRIEYCFYMESVSELLGGRWIARCESSDRRIFLLILLLYFFEYNHASWVQLRSIWRSIPDPYLSGEEIYFAFGRLTHPEYFYALLEFYNSAIVEDYVLFYGVVPRSLLQLSRIAVRNNLSGNFQLPHGIEQLGVGDILGRYLNLES